MENYLLIKGCAGLGNRIISLTKAIDYAIKTNRIIVIDWSDGLYFTEGYNFFEDYFIIKDLKYHCPHTTEISNLLENNQFSHYPRILKNQENLHL